MSHLKGVFYLFYFFVLPYILHRLFGYEYIMTAINLTLIAIIIAGLSELFSRFLDFCRK